jgi:allantoinase
MLSCETLIAGGTVVSGGRVFPADVALAGGRIIDLLSPGTRVRAAEMVDARGLHVLPGLIDTHVHTRHPGVEAREDFRSGTAAAAAGGITTLLEMPISKVPSNSAANLRRRIDLMASDAYVDFGVYGGAGQDNLTSVTGLADAGAVAFKTFLQPPPSARMDEFAGLWCTDETALRDLMPAVARTGLRHCFHCEHAGLLALLEARVRAAGRTTGRAHAEARPPIVEELSVAEVMVLAAEAGARVGVVHVSSPRSVALLLDARRRGVDVAIETCPPYLFFSDEALERLGPYAKCNPPLRCAADRDQMRSLATMGAFDYVGTDHSPFLAEEKASGHEDIFAAPPGLCGLDVFAPLMLTAVGQGWLTLPDVARLCAERAAEVFGLERKGRVASGSDADLTLVDVSARWTFDASSSLTRSRANMAIYDGMPLQGRVVSTWVRGMRAYEEGAIVGRPGHGRFTRPRDALVPG